ncbi:hypothetical protein BVU17_14860 [Haloarcula taiwanensis]|uniref:Uncharacterized protein n=1 Tax=Haloarcula taiwanensis TaxID=1932004 RepID=A0A2H5A1Y7_9EURY|nr:hypothetical protein BVU17_14860 [Haloarcula taiwanensis]
MLSYADWLSSGSTTVLPQFEHAVRDRSNVRSQNGQMNRDAPTVSVPDMVVRGVPSLNVCPLRAYDGHGHVTIYIAFLGQRSRVRPVRHR